MSSIVSKLDLQRENQLMKLLPVDPEPLRLNLLYKGSQHGFDFNVLNQYLKYGNAGQFVILIYLQSGSVRGAYFSKPPKENGVVDENAFLFALTPDSAFKYLQQEALIINLQQEALTGLIRGSLSFGECLKLTDVSYQKKMAVSFGTDKTFISTGWKKEPDACYTEVELHRVQNAGDVLNRPWRELSWSDEVRIALKENLVSYKPPCQGQDRVRVLLLGPAGSGKSSFINSVKSALYGRVMILPVYKKLKTSHIWSEEGAKTTALTLVEVPALGDDKKASGLSVSSALAVIRGQVPEGSKFVSGGAIAARPKPAINDEIHCAVFVLHACHVTTTSETLQRTLRDLQAEIVDMGIPQMVVLTHVDQVCHAVQEDVQHVYTSRILQDKMQKAAEVVGLPVSYVLPVRNYSSKLSVDRNMDILILSAANHILQAVSDTYEEERPPSSVPCPPSSVPCPPSSGPKI